MCFFTLKGLEGCIHVPETGHKASHGLSELHQEGGALEKISVLDLVAPSAMGQVAYFAPPKILAVCGGGLS